MFDKIYAEHMEYFVSVKELKESIQDAAKALALTVQKGQKLLICGNGGSAADAQHFAAELVGRFTRERSAWPAIALTADSSVMSALANDYGYEEVFSRQVKAHGKPGDFLIAISTSGNSANVIRAARAAKDLHMHTLALLGRDGGTLKQAVDKPIVVAGNTTARIQEAHMFILHYWAEFIEMSLIEGNKGHVDLS